jgi:hypothetical protein
LGAVVITVMNGLLDKMQAASLLADDLLAPQELFPRIPLSTSVGRLCIVRK